MATLESLFDELKALRSDVKSLTKLVRKVKAKQDDPTGEKAKERTANNGFNRPLDVSQELSSFLGLEKGEQISRSEVTRRVNQYINENNLKHPDNKRVIIMDDKLKKLLDPPNNIDVTFLNIQRYISPHYVKKTEPKEEKKVVKRPVVKKKST